MTLLYKSAKNPLNSDNTPLEIQRNLIPSNVNPLQLLQPLISHVHALNVVLVASFKFKDTESGRVEDFESDSITVWFYVWGFRVSKDKIL